MSAEAVAHAGSNPLFDGKRSAGQQWLVYVFTIGPNIALGAAVMAAWGWGIGWTDFILFWALFFLRCSGVTVGFHRYFTHGSFKAKRALHIALAILGSIALQGPVIAWVADHRRHHAFSDRDGDPHSPWLFGTSPAAIAHGFFHAHIGWLFERDKTNMERFAPDLLKDPALVWINKHFWLWTVISLTLPGVLGGLISWSWWGALTGFFWAGLVSVGSLYHVTWSVNSICHMIGERPFAARDRSANFWPLAIFSLGESWHNLHHADPTSARHGVKRGQIDISARIIWVFEKFGWAYNVRWPTPRRLAKLAAV